MIHLTLEAYNRRQYSTTNFDTAVFFSNKFGGKIERDGTNWIVTL